MKANHLLFGFEYDFRGTGGADDYVDTFPSLEACESGLPKFGIPDADLYAHAAILDGGRLRIVARWEKPTSSSPWKRVPM